MDWPARFVGAAAAVIDDSRRIVLVRHAYGALNRELPGGMSEPGESFEATALRGLREETGLVGRIERYACGWFPRGELPRPMTDFTLRRIDDAPAGEPPSGVFTIPVMRLHE